MHASRRLGCSMQGSAARVSGGLQLCLIPRKDRPADRLPCPVPCRESTASRWRRTAPPRWPPRPARSHSSWSPGSGGARPPSSQPPSCTRQLRRERRRRRRQRGCPRLLESPAHQSSSCLCVHCLQCLCECCEQCERQRQIAANAMLALGAPCGGKAGSAARRRQTEGAPVRRRRPSLASTAPPPASQARRALRTAPGARQGASNARPPA